MLPPFPLLTLPCCPSLLAPPGLGWGNSLPCTPGHLVKSCLVNSLGDTRRSAEAASRSRLPTLRGPHSQSTRGKSSSPSRHSTAWEQRGDVTAVETLMPGLVLGSAPRRLVRWSAPASPASLGALSAVGSATSTQAPATSLPVGQPSLASTSPACHSCRAEERAEQ